MVRAAGRQDQLLGPHESRQDERQTRRPRAPPPAAAAATSPSTPPPHLQLHHVALPAVPLQAVGQQVLAAHRRKVDQQALRRWQRRQQQECGGGAEERERCFPSTRGSAGNVQAPASPRSCDARWPRA